MKLFNYKALSLNTSLNKNILLPAESLSEFIENLQANTTLYHGYYDLEMRDNLAQYDGVLKPVFDTIHIDLDSKEDNGALAWEQTKALCKRLQESGCGFQVYFSGNKGFHVAIHTSAFGLTGTRPAKEYQDIIRSIAHNLKEQYSTVDPAIHDPVRKFRAYRSRNEKSGLYKIRLTGIGLKVSAMTIDEIRNLALMQPVHKYAHPSPVEKPVDFLEKLISSTPHHPQGARKSKVKELNQGETLQDDSLKFKNFADKRCIKQMMDGTVLPQFNRHDIELALIVEMRQQGRTLDEAIKLMEDWGRKVYTSEPDRLKDIDRQVRDIYKKDLEADKLYQYGCYGDVKSAYCSAKCKIYNNLDKKRRPEPLDCNKAQKTENELRRNPLLELSEGEIADGILKNLPTLVRCEGDYFWWVKTHWERLDRERFEEKIHEACILAYDNKAPNRILESLFNQIKKKLPVAPEDNCLFKTSPNKFNFSDGTCHVFEDNKGKVTLEMKPHDKHDYISYCAPFPLFADHDLPRSEKHDFEHFMEAKLRHLGADNVRILKQMMGAALIPYRPKIFFLVGEKDSGKSTHAMLLMKLLGHKNISVIDPVREKGQRFTWEEAIGKIANFSLELPQDIPLDTNSLKKVRDKMEMDIERKGIKKVRARLPFLHVYCANKMPPSLEGNTGALASRFIVVEYSNIGKEDLNGLSGIVNLTEHFWEYDAGAVLDWAREGLKELIESNFQYYTPESSRDFLSQWEKENDSVSLFLEDCASGEFRLGAEDGAENRSQERGQAIYKGYLRWAQEAGIRGTLKRIKFYDYLKKKARISHNLRGEGGIRFDWPWSLENVKNETGGGDLETGKNEQKNARNEGMRGQYEAKNELLSPQDYL
jgi:phage/plasmid-associated DNA primase